MEIDDLVVGVQMRSLTEELIGDSPIKRQVGLVDRMNLNKSR
jgi:hypothetical protein